MEESAGDTEIILKPKRKSLHTGGGGLYHKIPGGIPPEAGQSQASGKCTTAIGHKGGDPAGGADKPGH